MYQSGGQPHPCVAAIGSSAGGLEPLEAVISRLPASGPYVYVVAQQTCQHDELRVLLARDSPAPVAEAADGAMLRPGHIYVAPPDANILVKDDRLVLRRASGHEPKPSVDLLFQSVAHECGPGAVAIVLSGAGTDGSRGVQAVKSAGGYVIVQTPSTAKFTGMPQSAIDTGCANAVLSPEEIGGHLADLNLAAMPGSASSGPEDAIFQRVFAGTGIDLAAYQPKTIRRRVEQRMALAGAANLAEYGAMLEQNPEEVLRLVHACLVSVTSFFRDPDSFQVLGEVLAQSFPADSHLQPLRIWVPGCAGGHEAFSLAMLCDRVLPGRRVQIFATEPTEDSVNRARRGIFSTAETSAVPAGLLEKYFHPAASGFQVEKRIRDCVVFARHDILRDPVFLNLDLISCRNLLISLEPHVQHEVLQKFHRALRQGGLLFLGRSEHARPTGFEAVDKAHRIFRNLDVTEGERRNALVAGWMPPRTPHAPFDPAQGTNFAALSQASLDRYAPAAVLVDANLRILESRGEIGRFLTLRAGPADLSLLSMVPKEIASRLRDQVHRCQRLGEPAKAIERTIQSANPPYLLRTEVLPGATRGRTGGQTFVITFREIAAAAAEGRPPASHAVEELESQLSAAHNSLQWIVEQLETANGELQASSGELLSANEELASVNGEILSKSNELSRQIEELRNIHDSIDSPVIVLDGGGNLSYANREAAERLGVTPSMMGGKLSIPANPRIVSGLRTRIARVRDHGRPAAFHATVGERRYHVRLRPLGTAVPGGSHGQVISFHDETELHEVIGQSHRVEARLRELIESHRTVFDCIPARVAVIGADGVIRSVNGGWARFAKAGGLQDPQGCVGQNYLKICDEATGPGAEGAREMGDGIRKVLSGEIEFYSQDYPCHTSAQQRWFQCQVAQFTRNGVRGALVMHTDVSAEMKLREQLSRQAAALHSSVNAILILDTDDRIDWANDSLARMSGFAIAELVGKTPSVLEAPESFGSLGAMTSRCRTIGTTCSGEARMRSKGGEEYTVRQTATPIPDASGKISHLVVVQEDITQHKQAEQQMVYLTEHDDLTGLKNRKSFMGSVCDAIGRHSRAGGRMAVLFLDLDRFKDTNDTLGHLTGDQILVEIAARLRSCLRESDTLARFGGDEFVILVEQLTEKERVMLVVERILNSFNRPLEIEGRTIFLTASVGVTVYPDDGTTAEALLRNADLAMYRAKAEGRRGYRLYDEKLESEISQRFNIERELGRALGTNDIWLAFQPQIDLRTGAVAGAECLLRWSGCAAHDISVGRVISIAEESGAILPIGQWVLRQAIQQLRRWHDKGLSLRMSVNLSPVQFHQQDVFGIITDCLEMHGLPANALKAEITESVLLHRSARVKEMLHALHGAGIGLILDDFGTGYSSLTYLQHFPIEAVKIDSSFLHGVGQNKNDEAIVRGIIQLAHSLGQSVVAEGVETEEQMSFLKMCGCDYAQGYLMAKPLSAADFETFLEARGKLARAAMVS